MSSKLVIIKAQEKMVNEDIDKAMKCKIGETSESRVKCLQQFKAKIQGATDLYARLDDEFLLRFLRVSKFNVSRAYERLRKYYMSRKKYPIIFDTFYPSSTPSVRDAKHFWLSPYRAPDHSVVIIHKRGLHNPSSIVYEELLRLDILILESLVENPLTQMTGITALVDFQGYSFQHFVEDSPKRLYMALDAFQNAFPLRYSAVHILRPPTVFSLLYNIVSPFLSKKLKSRLTLHLGTDGWKSLHSHIAPEFLPEEYGGYIPQSKLHNLVEMVKDKEDYFQDNLKYGFVHRKK